MKVYMVSKQYYDEFYLFGIYSSQDMLDKALNVLANTEDALKDATRRVEQLTKWYEYRLAEGRTSDKPAELSMELLEVSKHGFDILEVEVDKMIPDGYLVLMSGESI